jgi:Zn-dependent protease
MSQNFNLVATAFEVMKFFVPFLFALCFHEFAHGLVAKWRGDKTAEMMGRLTLNPMAHADLVGTVIFPITSMIAAVNGVRLPLFGWAKPVPVDERNLKNPKADMFWIAAAGPLSNLFLATLAAVGLGAFWRYAVGANLDMGGGAGQIKEVVEMFIGINVFLAVFNLIPIHPLDGGKVLARFLPDRVNAKLEDVQQQLSFLLLILFVSGAARLIAYPAQWMIATVFLPIANGVATL